MFNQMTISIDQFDSNVVETCALERGMKVTESDVHELIHNQHARFKQQSRGAVKDLSDMRDFLVEVIAKHDEPLSAALDDIELTSLVTNSMACQVIFSDVVFLRDIAEDEERLVTFMALLREDLDI